MPVAPTENRIREIPNDRAPDRDGVFADDGVRDCRLRGSTHLWYDGGVEASWRGFESHF